MFSIELFEQNNKHYALVRAEQITEQLILQIAINLQELTGKRIKSITGHADFKKEWLKTAVFPETDDLMLVSPGIGVWLSSSSCLPKSIYMVTFND